jgi:hypothetical protein
MFTVQYIWKQKTRSALGIYHENFNEFLSFVTRGFIIIGSIFCHENVAIYHENYSNHIDGMLQFAASFFVL